MAEVQNALPITSEQKTELDRRMDAYEHDANPGRPADEVVAELRKAL
ncbi:MAG: addiction module protein [Immundisolibacter sp.]